MKTLKHLLPLAFLILFGSCQSKFHLQKRHYSKGYYISVSHPQPTTAQKITSSKPASVSKIAQTNVSPVNSESVTPVDSIKEPEKHPETMALIDRSKETKAFISDLHPTKKKAFVFKPKIKPSFNLVKRISASEREGHSLLWIVVVVLIILWALGIISGSFGLGILINLLLLIALILLILWLFRIV